MGGAIHNATPWGWSDCTLQLCEDGPYAFAAPGSYSHTSHDRSDWDTDVGYGIVYMTGVDCRNIGGATNGYVADYAWTACHLDICENGDLVVTRPDFGNHQAYGILDTSDQDCANLSGGMNPNFSQTRDCHLGLHTATPTCDTSTGQISPDHGLAPNSIELQRMQASCRELHLSQTDWDHYLRTVYNNIADLRCYHFTEMEGSCEAMGWSYFVELHKQVIQDRGYWEAPKPYQPTLEDCINSPRGLEVCMFGL